MKLVTDRAATIKLGDPLDPATEMGPVANQPQYEKVRGYLETALVMPAPLARAAQRDEVTGLPPAGAAAALVRPDAR